LPSRPAEETAELIEYWRLEKMVLSNNVAKRGVFGRRPISGGDSLKSEAEQQIAQGVQMAKRAAKIALPPAD
jgi:hypothetical protein